MYYSLNSFKGGLGFSVRWTPHSVIVTIRDNILGSSIFLLYHYYRVGVLLAL